MRFLGYIVFHQGIQIEEEWIKAICDWLEPQSVRDIQVFLRYANFYQQFIQRFSKFAALLTSMLKTISAVGPTVEVGDKEQDGKGIQVNGDEKKLA